MSHKRKTTRKQPSVMDPATRPHSYPHNEKRISIQTKPTGRKIELVLTIIGLAVAFGSWGYFALEPAPNIYIGSGFLGVCFFLFGAAFWIHFDSLAAWRIMLLSVVGILLSIPYFHWIHQFSRPSFTFIVPGVVVNSDSWDFIVNHRGPNSSESVEILFIDLDRQKDVLRKSPLYLSPQNIDSYERILKYPEVNPNGRGQLFALQFIWTPPVLDHEHYTIDITAKDRNIHQDLQVERVEGKWLWATQIKDSENGELLVNCKDPGFPYGPKAAIRCFPEMIRPGN